MSQNPKESDWKHFSDMKGTLRERYLSAKNQLLIQMLADPQKTPTESFWDTFEQMKQEARVLMDCLDGHSRSRMVSSMAFMCRHGMMEREDLLDFSEELQRELERCFVSR